MNKPLLIRNGLIASDAENMHFARGWVMASAGKISAIGNGDPEPSVAATAAETIDATGKIVLPGFTNAHTHLCQTFARGLSDGYMLSEWLKNVSNPLGASISVQEMELATLLGLAESIRGGCTGIVDHVKITSDPHIEASVKAGLRSGIRMILARAWRDRGENAESLPVIIEKTGNLIGRLAGVNSTIGVAFGPSSHSRCSGNSLVKTAEKALEWRIPIHMHVAETLDEVDRCKAENGCSPVEWLHRLGVLGSEFHAVHCVWVSDNDLKLLAESNALVIHCPVSNMYLASGIAPVQKMLKLGLRVGLGTDGAASNNSQDLLETAKFAALAAKVSTGDATAVKAEDVLKMLTSGGGAVFGARFGRIAQNVAADLTIIGLESSRCVPNHRTENTLVYSAAASDVDAVIVNGRVLMKEKVLQTIDEVSLLRECRHAASIFARRAGLPT
jgi:5-methylthioadenosine/S-adenosylhomocysteine deaminase